MRPSLSYKDKVSPSNNPLYGDFHAKLKYNDVSAVSVYSTPYGSYCKQAELLAVAECPLYSLFSGTYSIHRAYARLIDDIQLTSSRLAGCLRTSLSRLTVVVEGGGAGTIYIRQFSSSYTGPQSFCLAIAVEFRGRNRTYLIRPVPAAGGTYIYFRRRRYNSQCAGCACKTFAQFFSTVARCTTCELVRGPAGNAYGYAAIKVMPHPPQ